MADWISDFLKAMPASAPSPVPRASALPTRPASSAPASPFALPTPPASMPASTSGSLPSSPLPPFEALQAQTPRPTGEELLAQYFPPDAAPAPQAPPAPGFLSTVGDTLSSLASGAIPATAQVGGGALSLASTLAGGYPERAWRPVQAAIQNRLFGDSVRPEDITPWAQGTGETAASLNEALSSPGLKAREAAHAGDPYGWVKDPLLGLKMLSGFAPYVAAGAASGGAALPAMLANTGLIAAGSVQNVQSQIQTAPAEQLAQQFPDYPALAARLGDRAARDQLAETAGLKSAAGSAVLGGLGSLAGGALGGALANRLIPVASRAIPTLENLARPVAEQALEAAPTVLQGLAQGAIRSAPEMGGLMGGMTAAENWAMNRPVGEGVPESMAQGAAMGFLTGGPLALLHARSADLEKTTGLSQPVIDQAKADHLATLSDADVQASLDQGQALLQQRMPRAVRTSLQTALDTMGAEQTAREGDTYLKQALTALADPATAPQALADPRAKTALVKFGTDLSRFSNEELPGLAQYATALAPTDPQTYAPLVQRIAREQTNRAALATLQTGMQANPALRSVAVNRLKALMTPTTDPRTGLKTDPQAALAALSESELRTLSNAASVLSTTPSLPLGKQKPLVEQAKGLLDTHLALRATDPEWRSSLQDQIDARQSAAAIQTLQAAKSFAKTPLPLLALGQRALEPVMQNPTLAALMGDLPTRIEAEVQQRRAALATAQAAVAPLATPATPVEAPALPVPPSLPESVKALNQPESSGSQPVVEPVAPQGLPASVAALNAPTPILESPLPPTGVSPHAQETLPTPPGNRPTVPSPGVQAEPAGSQRPGGPRREYRTPEIRPEEIQRPGPEGQEVAPAAPIAPAPLPAPSPQPETADAQRRQGQAKATKTLLDDSGFQPIDQRPPINTEVGAGTSNAVPITQQGQRSVDVPLNTDSYGSNQSNSGFVQPIPDRGGTTTKLFGNIENRDAILEKGYGGLNRNLQRVVLSNVLSGIQDPKIFNSVINLIPVDVMNQLASEKFPSEMLFHDPSVLRDSLSSAKSFSPITLGRFIDELATASANLPTGRATKETFGARNTAGVSVNRNTTGTAIDDRQGISPNRNAEQGGPSVTALGSPSIMPKEKPSSKALLTHERASTPPPETGGSVMGLSDQPPVVVDKTHDVPFTAGPAQSQPGDPVDTVYIDARIPESIRVPSGEKIPTTPLIVAHEQAEKPLLDQGIPYEKAHEQATAIEKQKFFSDNPQRTDADWVSYQNTLKGHARNLQSAPNEKIPANLDDRPYQASGDQKTVAKIAAAQPTDQKFARARQPTASDADYLAAVERGDRATAQRMVEEAARAAGYTVSAYHAGTVEDQFDQKYAGTGLVGTKSGYIFFGSSKKGVGFYAEKGTKRRTRKYWLKFDNLKEFEGGIPRKNADNATVSAFQNDEEAPDGTVTRGVTDGDTSMDVYTIAYNDYGTTEQAKLADPITRDDAGHVIPLSQRFDRNQPDIRYAQSDHAETPVTAGHITDTLKALSDDPTVQVLLDNGKLRIVERQAELPDAIPVREGQRVAAAVDPKTGRVYLVAEHFTPAELDGLLQHDVAVHQQQLGFTSPPSAPLRLAQTVARLVGARGVLGEAAFNDTLAQLERLRFSKQADVVKAFETAQSAMKGLGQNPALLREESLAYFLSDPNNKQIPLVRRVVAAVRTFLYRAGFKLQLTTDDLRSLAVSALRSASRTPVQENPNSLGVNSKIRSIIPEKNGAFSNKNPDTRYAGHAEDAEATRQYADVVARYTLPDGTKAPGWLKAPNGKPTNLNERQWVQTQTPAFKAWAKNNQVVDANGDPLAVYHGTSKKFNVFKSDKTMDGVFWFSSDKAAIESGEVGAANHGAIMPVFLSAKKLAGWDEYDRWGIDELIQKGYDGLHLDDDYVVFHPTQIKSSVSNTGAFSPTNPDIRYAEAKRTGKISPEEDAAYRKAIEQGDQATAQRMVEEAARAAGYSTTKQYHGTYSKDFTVFDTQRGESLPSSHLGAFFTPSKQYADLAYGPKQFGGRVVGAYLKLSKPYEMTWEESNGLTDESAKKLRRRLESEGYDSIVLNHAATPEVAVFSSNQIKSADPVVRDDAGHVIPLSQRFNPQVSDIRYAIASPVVKAAQATANRLPDSVKDWGKSLLDSFKRGVVPMAMGTDQERALVKDTANAQRAAQYEAVKTQERLTRDYTPRQLEQLWTALDDSSTAALKLERGGLSRADAKAQVERQGIGLFALPRKMRDEALALSSRADANWANAKRVGLVAPDAQGLPWWTPRIAALIGEDGTFEKVGQGAASGRPSGGGGGDSGGGRPLDMKGINFSTTSPNLKQRKHLEAADTEAAMQAKFGPDAGLVRDLRAMPLAMARLEHAIAARELINQIKVISAATGNPETFTLPHPAFQTYQPKLEPTATGSWKTVKDSNGQTVFEKKPIYISSEFEGPLRALLSTKPSAWYRGAMELKRSAMNLIMFTPLLHFQVVLGKALPAVGGKLLTTQFWREGGRALQDPVAMREWIKDGGLVPLNAGGFHPDIPTALTSLSGHDSGLITKGMGKAVGLVSPKAGAQVEQTLGSVLHFWHQTLLWDQIAKLQLGMAEDHRQTLLAQGVDRLTATRRAADLANRFVGAMPREAMSEDATRLANIALFSRSWTLGNLSLAKMLVTGMPSDTLAQIRRDAGPLAAAKAVSGGRSVAVHALMLDVGLMYATNALLQGVIDYFHRDKSIDQIEQGYVRRLGEAMHAVKENPLNLFPTIFLSHLDPTHDNEPGKEGRIFLGRDPVTGTASYTRGQIGKVGEEYVNWAVTPLDMFRKKLSTLVRPPLEVLANRDWAGKPVYDVDTPGMAGMAQRTGQIVTHIMEAQAPVETLQAAVRMFSGTHRPDDPYKTWGPLLGMPFGSGYPGGPELGQMAATNRRHEAAIQEIRPDVRDHIKDGDVRGAIEIMMQAGMTPSQMRALLISVLAPESRLTGAHVAQFEKVATPEERQKLTVLIGQR